MPTYLLRVEGVNLRSVIFDTDDLSTRRGGGLMLLNAVAQLREQQHDLKLCPIITGASIGLYTFETTDETAAGRVREQVVRHFHTHTMEYDREIEDGKVVTEHVELKHATFVVDVRPAGDTNTAQHDAVQQLIAANRWRQQQQPSIALADLWAPATDACARDWVRPGTVEAHLQDGERVKLSASVAQRRAFGRDEKQNFYRRELQGIGAECSATFTNEFDGISKAGIDPKSEFVTPTAFNKLAVFYADGNKFGQRALDRLKSHGLEGYGKWSDAIKRHHRTLLRDLLKRAEGDPSWQNGGAIRLETLLWGGDEIIWVVPAWKGWELAQWFLSAKHEADGEQLSYGCGLVFCNTKAPIQKIIELAQNVAEFAKDHSKRADKNESCLAYEVMESFDDVTGDLGAHRRKWLTADLKTAQADPLVLTAGALCAAYEAVRSIAKSDEFPTRQLYARVHAWRKGDAAELARADGRLKAPPVGEQIANAINALTGNNPGVGHLHLLQMLPYIPKGGEK